ncbi:DNRLRE domain-containing protein [Microbacterium enclense]|uniref:CBM96 family carbohydrate-binding protein n=1 Tax=Microbacterium enclense TaxID=993073 RepID=UPI0021A28DB7|nr:DNRLRE domain-containing protein [Microbacterium enclense]MCT2085761.1 DNRLRE domain-containing protein [Microbacterium enclense]
MLVGPIAAAPAAQANAVAAIDVQASHPRLLVESEDDFVALRSQAATDAVSARLQKNVLNSADYQLTQPVASYDLRDPSASLKTAKALVDRAYSLALAWRLTGAPKYMEGLWANLDAASRFPDWAPDNVLQVGEISNAFAIAYDWGYTYWTEARRAVLRNAILEKGLRPTIAYYASPGGAAGSWVTETHNRNVVGNSGLGLASLAIMSEDTSGDARRVLDYSVESIKSGLTGYLPDGSYAEGPMYWEYATDYATTFLNALQTATGSTHGLEDIGGLAKSGTFIRDLMSPSGDYYTFSDSETVVYPAMGFSGLARLTGDTSLEAISASMDTSRRAAQRLIWRDAAVEPVSPGEQSRPRVADYPGVGVVTLRGDSVDASAPFAALHYGGDPSVGHRQVDAGDVMVSVGGVVWAEQLGLDRASYEARGNGEAVSARWTYYRNRLEGHNTLQLDRDTMLDYRDAPGGSLISSGNSSLGSYAIADLSVSQTAAEGTWRRGIRVVPTAMQVVLQDEFSLPSGITTRWGLHTSAVVDITEDGRSAVLYKGGQRLQLELAAPGGARLRATPASPSPVSPSPAQDLNQGVTKLVVDVSGGSAQAISVTMTLLPPAAAPAPRAGQVRGLGTWTAAPEAAVELSAFTVDGAAVAGFDPSRRSYTLHRDPAVAAPIISARDAEGTALAVTASSVLPGSYIIGPNAATGVLVTVVPDTSTVVSATASATLRGSTTAVYDANESTGWAASGVQYIELAFRGDIDLHRLDVLWTANTSRRIDHRILVPTSSGWTAITTGSYRSASGWSSNQFDTPSRVSKVRIEVSGDPGGDRTSTIREVVVYGYRDTPTPANLARPTGGVTLSAAPASVAAGEWAPIAVTLSGAASGGQVELVSANSGVARIDGKGAVGVTPGTTVLGGYVRSGAWEFASPSRSMAVVASQSLAIGPSQDTFVEGGVSATRNFGSADRLDVKPTIPATPADGTRVRTSLLRFDLSSIDPARIASAVLVLNGTIADGAAGDAVRVDAYRVDGSWTDKQVTYATRPAFGAPVGSTLVTRQVADSRLDLTAVLKASRRADLGSFELALGGSAPDNTPLMARFGSSESASPPRIEIVLAPATATIASSAATGTVRGTVGASHDGSTSTGWAGGAGASVTWTLPAPTLLKTLRADWSPDASKKVMFKVLTSLDGSTWIDDGTFTYSGGPGQADHALKWARTAKYVRIQLDSTSSTWQGILREIQILSPGSAPAAVPDRLFVDAAVNAPATIPLGQTVGVEVTASDLTGTAVGSVQVTHSSDSPGVLAVGADGRLTGNSTGTAKVTTTITQGPLSRSWTNAVTVYQPGLSIVRPDGDTFAQGGTTATTTFGDKTRLDVKPQGPRSATDGTGVRHAYLTFDLSAITPASVQSAKLSLSGALIDDPTRTETRVDLYEVTGPWAEATTTYSNRPALGTRIASFTVTRDVAVREIDLTSYVRGLPEGKRISIALGGTVDTMTDVLMTRFDSREAGEATGPKLTIQENVSG